MSDATEKEKCDALCRDANSPAYEAMSQLMGKDRGKKDKAGNDTYNPIIGCRPFRMVAGEDR
jgi:hypothetical protein